MGERIASPQAKERGRRWSARIDSWAAEHRALSTLLVGVLCVVLAWMVARKHDGATTGELVFWAVILVPIGIVSTWSSHPHPAPEKPPSRVIEPGRRASRDVNRGDGHVPGGVTSTASV
ncbi:hypothetical protein [Amycolatopsis magusensis]|uniref:hypothetical protein n=1 Tax=Amycolatopsis magusensis TaxID=882444 RepID=UPI0024A7DD33|nr:hypothetical protein [Amycolatopsis magusensis]MDI5980722.1 hypothetical protein [Amycolatopsis magusensis]